MVRLTEALVSVFQALLPSGKDTLTISKWLSEIHKQPKSLTCSTGWEAPGWTARHGSVFQTYEGDEAGIITNVPCWTAVQQLIFITRHQMFSGLWGGWMSLPSSVVEVNNEGVVSKLLKCFIMVSIHVSCTRREQSSENVWLRGRTLHMSCYSHPLRSQRWSYPWRPAVGCLGHTEESA